MHIMVALWWHQGPFADPAASELNEHTACFCTGLVATAGIQQHLAVPPKQGYHFCLAHGPVHHEQHT